MSVDYQPPGTPLYLTPNSLPVGRFCRTISVPDSPEWVGLVDGVLSALNDPYVWRQFGALTPDQAAAAWQAMIVNAWTIEGCPLEVRQNPTSPCVLEQSTDQGATWTAFADLSLCAPVIRMTHQGQIQITDGAGGFDPIPLAPVPTDTFDGVTPNYSMTVQTNDQCTAAANVANTLRQLYKGVGDTLTEQPSIGIASLIGDIAATIAELFGTVILIDAAAALAGSLVALQLLYSWTNLTDKQFEQLVCVIYNNMTGTAGNWTINGAGISSDLGTLAASAPLPWSFVNLIGTYIGADGLQLAAKTTAIPSWDCTTHDTSNHYDHTEVDNAFSTGVSVGFVFNETSHGSLGWAFTRAQIALPPGGSWTPQGGGNYTPIGRTDTSATLAPGTFWTASSALFATDAAAAAAINVATGIPTATILPLLQRRAGTSGNVRCGWTMRFNTVGGNVHLIFDSWDRDQRCVN